jgi:hypothetical protein
VQALRPAAEESPELVFMKFLFRDLPDSAGRLVVLSEVQDTAGKFNACLNVDIEEG